MDRSERRKSGQLQAMASEVVRLNEVEYVTARVLFEVRAN